MKKLMLNIMATTGITLLVLCIIALCYGARYLEISGVFQSLLVNILIHIGYLIFDKLDYKHPIWGNIFNIGSTCGIVLVSGWVYGWYNNMPMWCLTFMTIIIYVSSEAINALTTLEEVRTINNLLRIKKEGKNYGKDA